MSLIFVILKQNGAIICFHRDNILKYVKYFPMVVIRESVVMDK